MALLKWVKKIEKILKRFKMKNCNLKSLPCDLSVNNSSSLDPNELPDSRLYWGILNHLINDLGIEIKKANHFINLWGIIYDYVLWNVRRYFSNTTVQEHEGGG